jgi:hypothetical protein
VTAQEQFAAKVEALIKDARDFGPAVRDRVMQLLEEARKRIVGDISNVDPESFKGAQLRLLAKQIDGAMDGFRRDFSDAVTTAQGDAYELGGISMAQPLDALGFDASTVAGISESALSIAQGYTADLISGLTKDSAAKLNAAIQRAFLGGQSVSDVIAQIGRALAGDKFTGLFGPIADRAETIALNEILRVHSMAGQARLEDLQAKVPSVQKQRVPRLSHIRVSGMHVPVDEPFIVAGEELMYPRDPNGSAENTINCHCLLAPYIDTADLQPTAAQKQVLKDSGVQISVTP